MYVKYIQKMGDDLTVTNAARISFDQVSTEMSDRDIKLTHYLADNEHYSTFEHCVLSVEISVPAYISKQIMRHRTAAYNEVSRRYTSQDLEFYVPTCFSKQAASNRQAADGLVSPTINKRYQKAVQELITQAELLYEHMLFEGISREEARGVLPQCMYTKFIMTMNLRNWVHFIKLRKPKNAQKQVQFVAKEIEAILLQHFPISTKALLCSKTLSPKPSTSKSTPKTKKKRGLKRA